MKEGDVYAHTGDSLRAMYHAVEPDNSFTGSQVALTLRVTKLHLQDENELPFPMGRPLPMPPQRHAPR